MDTVLRLEPAGDTTRLVVECDYDIAFRLPGFLKDLLGRHWGEPNSRQMMATVKTLAEARVLTHA